MGAAATRRRRAEAEPVLRVIDHAIADIRDGFGSGLCDAISEGVWRLKYEELGPKKMVRVHADAGRDLVACPRATIGERGAYWRPSERLGPAEEERGRLLRLGLLYLARRALREAVR